jgi:hypothetical protein
LSRRQRSIPTRAYQKRLAPILLSGLCLAACSSTLLNQTPAYRSPLDPERQGAALPCDAWSEPQQTGSLEHLIIPEASGIAASRAFENRLYHNNDSGDGPHFYVTDQAGAATQTVTIEGFNPFDVEAMSLGPCPLAGVCIYLGDIGDNFRGRSIVRIVVIAEQEQFAERVTPQKIIMAKYPDDAHDAEGMAVHPNGDLFILTKEYSARSETAFPAQLYRLSAEQIAMKNGEVEEMEYLGELDLPQLLSAYGRGGQLVTGMDISADGKRALIITYQTVLELLFEPVGGVFAEGQQSADKKIRDIPIEVLPQMEAIAYASDQKSFYYDTEYNEGFGSAPIHSVACLNFRSAP